MVFILVLMLWIKFHKETARLEKDRNIGPSGSQYTLCSRLLKHHYIDSVISRSFVIWLAERMSCTGICSFLEFVMDLVQMDLVKDHKICEVHCQSGGSGEVLVPECLSPLQGGL